jgi:two-component system, cell cycle sensor histidine kinase and response regulator CckA
VEEPRFEFQAHELRTALDFLREGIQVLSPEWRYLYVNEAVARHGKKPREELLGRTMLECYPGIEQTHVFSVLEDCMRRRSCAQIENKFEYEDGKHAWFELRIEPCDEGLIVLSLDITERKRMEQALQQNHKLRALGQMAASVAHDLNNILGPIGLHVQMLRRAVKGDEDLDEMLALIEAAVRTGADTVKRLRNFSRQERELPAEPTDPQQMTELALQICRPRVSVSVHEAIVLRQELSATPRVLVRPSELVSAIVNLIMNAIEALSGTGSGTGTITVRTGSDDNVWIEVADDGPGMPPEVERRVLEPFFTTKPQGTGLGLAMVYALVKRHGGRLEIDTGPGRGTTVRLSLPASDAVEHERAVAAPDRRRPLGRLLVVDDEPMARTVLETLLVEEGFMVEIAGSAVDAFAKATAFQPDVLLTDFQLPDMDGAALSRWVRASHNDLPVLIMSGFDETHDGLADLLREPRIEHIQKPIDLDQLMMRLERMLEATRPQ